MFEEQQAYIDIIKRTTKRYDKLNQAEQALTNAVTQLIDDGNKLTAVEWIEVIGRVQKTFVNLALRETWAEEEKPVEGQMDLFS